MAIDDFGPYEFVDYDIHMGFAHYIHFLSTHNEPFVLYEIYKFHFLKKVLDFQTNYQDFATAKFMAEEMFLWYRSDYTRLHEYNLRLEDRLYLIDRYAYDNPGKPVSHKILEVFPSLSLLVPDRELTKEPLPLVAPATWKVHRLNSDTPATFIMRHYFKWVGNGLTRGHVNKLDRALYMALYRWEKNDDRDIPYGFDVPDKGKIAAEEEGMLTEENIKHVQRVLSRRQRYRRKEEQGGGPESNL